MYQSEYVGGLTQEERSRIEWEDQQATLEPELPSYFREVAREFAVAPESVPAWRENLITAADLQSREYPPVSYAIPGILPEGLAILAGAPKMGKSWMALDMALAVAGGRFCLGDRKPEQGDVLYLALEDNPRRLKARIDRVLGDQCEHWPADLSLTTTWKLLDDGGVDDLSEWARSVDRPRLVIVDTLAKVRKAAKQGYAEDYEALSAIHRFANDNAMSVLAIHHTRKEGADDPLEKVSGTFGVTGNVDTVMVLNQAWEKTEDGRNFRITRLHVRGRDIQEAAHQIRFNDHTCRWTIDDPTWFSEEE